MVSAPCDCNTTILRGRAAACAGNPAAKVPWTVLQADSRPYIAPEYLPLNVKLSEPSKMRQQDIDLLVDHWHTRQEDKKIKTIFEFKAYQGSDKQPRSRRSLLEDRSKPRARPTYKKGPKGKHATTPEDWRASDEESSANSSESESDDDKDESPSDGSSKDTSSEGEEDPPETSRHRRNGTTA